MVSCTVSIIITKPVRNAHGGELDGSYVPALPTLDPTFRRVTLQNERVKSVVRDLGLHKDPAGTPSSRHRVASNLSAATLSVLSGQLILKPPKVGSDCECSTGTVSFWE